MATKVSFTYLFQILEGCLAILRALISNSSLWKLATMGLMGVPMAASFSC